MTEFIAHIGTDESGKGDFFGPLVIAGVLVDEKNAQYFHELGIKDSKKLSDKKMPLNVISPARQRWSGFFARQKKSWAEWTFW